MSNSIQFGWDGDSEWGVLTCKASGCRWAQACQQRDAKAVIKEHLATHSDDSRKDAK